VIAVQFCRGLYVEETTRPQQRKTKHSSKILSFDKEKRESMSQEQVTVVLQVCYPLTGWLLEDAAAIV